MSEMVGSLKMATLQMNRLVVEQNIHLDQIQTVALDNMDELDDQKSKM
jgi:hypothetical protein|tara:strand:+ start:349 stop:492 length:144 start_codon:yes stop_codon:yes gene_type:complete